ncbi:MAG TPA: hypothetical protein VIS48_10655 [Candidatus Kryptonia bacterium]
MKKKLVLLATSMSLVLSACSTYMATIKPVLKSDDVVISPELRAFLKKTPNPVVVLRVPYTTEKVTEAEQKTLTRYNNAYNEIEKDLMKAGFTVRDRGLLNNLLQSGQTDYSEIGKRIQTDLILEIEGIDFEIDNKIDQVTDKETGNTLQLVNSCYLNPQFAKLDCKIIIVEKGQTGAVLALYRSSLPDGCAIEVSNDLSTVRDPGTELWHSSETWKHDLNEDSMRECIDFFADKVARVLRGEEM